MPIAGYVAMAIEALMQVEEEQYSVDWTKRTFKIVDLALSRSLIVPDETPIEIFFSLKPVQESSQLKVSWFDFMVSSFRKGITASHCQGRAAILQGMFHHYC